MPKYRVAEAMNRAVARADAAYTHSISHAPDPGSAEAEAAANLASRLAAARSMRGLGLTLDQRDLYAALAHAEAVQHRVLRALAAAAPAAPAG